MKIKMKEYEYSATEHAKRYSKAWDYYSIAVSGYLAGYRQAREDIIKELEQHIDGSDVRDDQLNDFLSMTIDCINETGKKEVPIELTDGEHQLSAMSFDKWKKELTLEECLEQYFDVSELRVYKDKDGKLSFQGVARKR